MILMEQDMIQLYALGLSYKAIKRFIHCALKSKAITNTSYFPSGNKMVIADLYVRISHRAASTSGRFVRDQAGYR